MSTKKQLKIITLPHASLRTPSRRVGLIDDEVKQLIKEMEEQTLLWDESRDHEVTVGLAAVQINKLMRVVIIREDFDDKENKNYIALINPEITKYEGEVVEGFEGCLSVKDYYAKVPRHERVKLKATTVDGQEVRISADGFLARVLQHEVDHIKGITTVDRVETLENGFQRVNDKGEMEPVDHTLVIKAGILKDD